MKAFCMTPNHQKKIDRWVSVASPVLQFLRDDQAVRLDWQHSDTPAKKVYRHYRRWLKSAGFRYPMGRKAFLELLEAFGGQVGVRVHKKLVSGLLLRHASD
jgi:hypothetical protein